jgi:hypothetical protein
MVQVSNPKEVSEENLWGPGDKEYIFRAIPVIYFLQGQTCKCVGILYNKPCL